MTKDEQASLLEKVDEISRVICSYERKPQVVDIPAAYLLYGMTDVQFKHAYLNNGNRYNYRVICGSREADLIQDRARLLGLL